MDDEIVRPKLLFSKEMMMKNGNKSNKYELGYLIMFFFLFPQSILGQISDIFTIGDEIFAIIGILVFLSHYSRKIVWKKYPQTKKIISLALIISLIGWLSSFIYKIQPNISINIADCFTFLKFFAILFLAIYLLQRSRFKKVILPIYRFTTFYIIISFILLIISQVIDIGMSDEIRFGLNDFIFLHSNAGDYSSILILALVIFHIVSYYINKPLNLLKFLTVVLIIFTFRGKALGFVATYIMIIFFINRFNKISGKTLVLLGLLGLMGGYFQIRYYFVDNITPRSLFLANGIITANDYFPLGAGFSTYGSNMAKIHYSPLYDKYGFNEIWGMNEEEHQFLNDNFWPMIMGQYGWIGMLLYIGILLIIFKLVNNKIQNKQLKIAGLSVFFLLVYSSVGGPIFVHYIGCVSIIIFSLILKGNQFVSGKFNNSAISNIYV